MNEEERLKILTNQILYGCDMIPCDNKLCANCLKFSLIGKSKEEKINFAKEFAKDPSSVNAICPYQPPLLVEGTAPTKLSNFKQFLVNFKPKTTTPEDIINNIKPIMTDVSIFSLLFRKDENSNITDKNFNIDEKEFFDFASAISSIPEINQELLNLISSLSSQIIGYGSVPPLSILRSSLIIFYFPAVISPQTADILLIPLVNYLANLNETSKFYISNNLSQLPILSEQIIGDLHFAISYFFATQIKPDPHSKNVGLILQAMKIIYTSNLDSPKPLPSKMFYNHHINEAIDYKYELEHSKELQAFSFLSYPFILSLNTKSEICKLESQMIMEGAAIRSVLVGLVFNGQFQQSDMFLNLTVRRDHIIEDTLSQLYSIPATNWLKKLRVVFEGENAVDVGGPSREFIFLLSEQLFSPDYGMFQIVNNRYLWFSPLSYDNDNSFILYGLVVGLAVYNNILMPIRFPLVMYKKLLGISQFRLFDLEEIDPDLARGLQQMLDMKARGEDVSDLSLTFEATVDYFGKPKTYPLIRNGNSIDVTNDNVEKYVESYIDFLLFRSVQLPFSAFKKGFEIVCRADMYKTLAPDELDIFVSGEEVMDWDSLKRFCTYNGYDQNSRAIKWFWEIFDEMPDQEKVKFLKFSTGTDRAPLGGLGSIKLVIQKEGSVDRLPVAHTCFNTFSLPNYRSKQIMKHKIYLAIDNTEGFGFK